MERTTLFPSRRGLLKGAALTAVPLALLPDARAAARPRAVDHPGAAWHPAIRANYTPSHRPRAHPLHYVVIHVAQTTYAGTLSVFRNPRTKVSAHYVVRSDGKVAQCVRESDIAWHAGNWDYNTRTIGIEHEGWVDRPGYFTDAMYERSARLTAAICARYDIPRNRAHIIGHHEVPGSDHTDPGRHWDWKRYLRLVNSA
ncbi:N-acetylmuramoyl-L-alanine amidase [Streptomyces lomondensis]|uniref:N-acetylmuramoyl-L-alanine amidase n=1 Tax=Streptomyces lomondensis TaxID=68229 RepID=A0ABQ2X535_9ACTN|nr:N-acetylmuramoyl-L-alanine amidase [Streptomyces lomondensis]MCF0078076.1 N-acetylmuramoyl-L-alanine amidase [Streptomyces lomondensis]GGX00214.1 amidase [Streptomyces lomondensis]